MQTTHTRESRKLRSALPSPCGMCGGTGQHPFAPQRQTPNGVVIHIVKPCTECEGHGVLQPMKHRDLLNQISFASLVVNLF